jgi:predicted trehalose synthase
MPALLRPWLAEQRWFAAKGSELVGLDRVGGLRLQDDDGQVGVEVHLVAARGADGAATVYQIPLTYRSTPDPRLEHARIGQFHHPVLGERTVYDGPHDPVFVRALLRLLAGGRAAAVEGMTGGAVGVMQRVEPPTVGPSRVLSGEQSNTSIIVDPTGPDAMIVKLFRVLHPGSNPDVIVQTRLATAGCDRIPRPIGWIEGSWAGPGGDLVSGHLAYACEFMAESEDAWRVACRAVEAGESFAEQAWELGAATAQVHLLLAQAMPTRPADPRLLAQLADGLVGRVHWAVGLVPQLAPFAAAALRAMDAVRSVQGAADLQQVHGDYHLGQVLHSPARGWVLLDFEGEPLRPLAERLEPDLALRDVAGMTRSFDYAAQHATVGQAVDDPGRVAATAWSAQAREAFLAGYARAGGHHSRADAELLRALELDKAMYETVYETLNRPGWVDIPMSAVRRLALAD